MCWKSSCNDNNKKIIVEASQKNEKVIFNQWNPACILSILYIHAFDADEKQVVSMLPLHFLMGVMVGVIPVELDPTGLLREETIVSGSDFSIILNEYSVVWGCKRVVHIMANHGGGL